MNKKIIKVLSLPARHPYMSKFNNGTDIKFVNPDTDLFSTNEYSKEHLNRHYPPQSYDIVHIHFSFDIVPLDKFERLLKYFRVHKKPIVWTCHNRESLRIKNYGKGKYQKLLFKYSKQIISPTYGCAQWVKSQFGNHKNKIEIIPLGFMANPDDVQKFKKIIKKNKNIFTMLIGDFRENKEFVQSIINFLQCTELNKTKLQLIYKPINLYKNNYDFLDNKMLAFWLLTQHHRIINISLPNISNDVLTKAFLSSHAVILPYKWGTHSGQIELAKDCGCYVAVPNLGYYKEQWDKIYTWNVKNNKYSDFSINYTNILIDIYQHKSLSPIARERRNFELRQLIKKHVAIYKDILRIK